MRKSIYLTLSRKDKKINPDTFVIDNKIGGDDYIFWIKEFEKKDYDIYFVNWDDYSEKMFSNTYHYNSSKFISNKKLTSNDAIFLYKQEGFLLSKNISRFRKMLNELEELGVFIINDPETIRWNISKEHIYYLMENNAKVCKIYKIKDIIQKVNNGEKFVVKPKIASRGDGLIFINSKNDLLKIKNSKNSFKNYVAQEFCDDIRKGEKSLFFIGNKYSHAVLKIPNPNNKNEIRCNKSIGGIISKYSPTKKEIKYSKGIIEIISKKYKTMYSRIDFAYHKGGPHVIEAELLNPSAFAIFAGVGEKFAKNLVNFLDNKIEEHLK